MWLQKYYPIDLFTWIYKKGDTFMYWYMISRVFFHLLLPMGFKGGKMKKSHICKDLETDLEKYVYSNIHRYYSYVTEYSSIWGLLQQLLSKDILLPAFLFVILCSVRFQNQHVKTFCFYFLCIRGPDFFISRLCIYLAQLWERVTKWLIKIMPWGMQKFSALKKWGLAEHKSQKIIIETDTKKRKTRKL